MHDRKIVHMDIKVHMSEFANMLMIACAEFDEIQSRLYSHEAAKPSFDRPVSLLRRQAVRL
jgi:hypothetical protein